MEPKSLGLTAPEAQRYGRHIVLPGFGPEGQRRLKGASAVVVGLGGLGVSAAVHLVSAGVGTIGLVDGDAVELSNLQRQFLFSEADVGRNKAEVAKERLGRVNPLVNIQAYPSRLMRDNALPLLAQYEVVLDCTDNLPARYLISDACVLLSRPEVYASAAGHEGQAAVFHAGDGPCYRCLFPTPPPPESLHTCEEAGVLSVVPGVLGTVQANMAIEVILGKVGALSGKLIVYNGMDVSFDEVRIKKSPACSACGPRPTVTGLIDYEEFCGKKSAHVGFDITPRELKFALDGGARPVLLDVREPYEYEICHLDGAVLVPMSELPRRLTEFKESSEIIVYCHVGVRSASATAFLRASGYAKARSLTGGIDAWSTQVDSETPRY